MSMKRTLILTCLVGLCAPLWAQPKIPLKRVVKPPRRVAATPAEVLARTRAFIETHGHRPRTDLARYPGKLAPAQLDEQKLSDIIFRTLGSRIRDGYVDAQDPDVLALRELVHQYPNPPKKIDFDATVEELRTFVEEYGRQPRSTIYNGKEERIPTRDLSPEERNEVLLAKRSYEVKKQLPGSALAQEVDNLFQRAKQLQAQARRQAQEVVVNQLEQFVQQEQRIPLCSIEGGLPLELLDEEEKQEVRLRRKIQVLLRELDAQDPLAVRARQLLEEGEKMAMPDISKVLIKAKNWTLRRPYTRPRKIILQDRHPMPLEEMTPAQRWEVKLARQIELLLKYTDSNDPQLAPLIELWKKPYRTYKKQ